jgi:DNA-binding NarL/FixJ family response regulator
MEILLIESDARRRVTVAKHLASNSHRVTIASSVGEAQEILRFLTTETATPRVVIIDEKLHRGEGSELRAELAVRFPHTNWIPLRADLELDWLARWLELLAERDSKARRRKGAPPLEIVLIEANEVLRKIMSRHLALWGDRVTACSTVEEARKALSEFAGRRTAPRAIVSQVAIGEGDGIGFFLAARRCFPDLRWIIIAPPQLKAQLRSPASAEGTLSVLDDLRRAMRSISGGFRPDSLN